MKRVFIFIIILTIFSINLFAKMQIDIDVKAKNKRKIPICVVKFKPVANSDKIEKINNDFFDAIINDLSFSDNFKIYKQGNYNMLGISLTQKILKLFHDAEFVIDGQIGTMLDNQIFFKVRIFDLFLKRNKLYKNYYGDKKLYRRIAHKISNEILWKLTGEKSIFEDKILYVSDKTGTKQIFLMDYDGKGSKRLINDNNINLNPKIHGNYMYYTSFINGRARVFVKNLKTGKIKLLIKKGSFSAGADINSKGDKIVAMFEDGGDSEIGIFDTNGKLIKQLTNNIFNESSPVWSNDGSKIAYVSNRTGTPQIYIYNLKTHSTMRLTYTSTYCAFPNWGHNDTYVYFASRVDGKFKICRMSIGAMHYEQLTFGDFSDEFPYISKNGKFLLFTREINFIRQIFILNLESEKVFQVTNDKNDKSYPVWYKGKF